MPYRVPNGIECVTVGNGREYTEDKLPEKVSSGASDLL